MLAGEDPDYAGNNDVAAAEILGGRYAMMLAADRKANPRDDLITKLIQAHKGERGLTDDEFGYFVILLAVAGNETARNAISHGINAFLDNPEQWEIWKRDRPATMVDEVVRWGTPVNVFQRTALNDVDVTGHLFKKGERAALFYAAPTSTRPSSRTRKTFNVLRDPNPQLGFGGHGAHYCLGANLARQEIRVIFDALADHAPDIRQAGGAGAVAALLDQRDQGPAGQVRRTPTPYGVPSGGPLGENQRAVCRDGHRVLHVRTPRTVLAAQRPAVGVGVDLVSGVQEPRFDGDHEAGTQLESTACASVVGDVRLAVHGAADAVPAELEVDAEARSPGHVTDGRRDVAEPVAGLRCCDAGLKRAAGGRDQASLLARRPDDDAERGVGDPAIDTRREVDADEVAVLQHVVVGETVQDRVVDRGAQDLAKRRGAERRVVVDVAGLGAALADHLVGELVELEQVDARRQRPHRGP